MIRVPGLWLVLVLSALAFQACGGGGGGSTSSPGAPTPALQAISPNSSHQGGPAFTLSLVGSNFLPNSTARWNGSDLQTSFVSSSLLTAQVPASALTSAGPDAITVASPGGGSSSAINFAVPCVIDPPGPAAAQTKARVGAYYFDGWSASLTNFHFAGMALGPYQDREPVTAWQDSAGCAVEQQLAQAHNVGIDFFVFDWYFNTAVTANGENLNSALRITHALPNKHGMQYAILYVTGAPFDVDPANWPAAVNEWVSYMTDPAYLRINGLPALFIINVGSMRQVWGSAAAVNGALGQLRSAAQAQGLGGVYVVGGFGVPDGTMGQASLGAGFSIAGTDGYDAIAFYGYPFAPPAVNGSLPFSTLAQAGQWAWDQAALSSPLPFIPTAMSGWDPRPWNEVEPNSGFLMWYSRTPAELAQFISDSIDWTAANPQLRPEATPTPPLVLIEAWNELGEGSYIVPTKGIGTTYSDAIGAMLLGP